MAEREVLLLLLVLLTVSSGHAEDDLILTPKETNIVAYENEKAVLPCQPTSSRVNMTLYEGEFSWSLRRIYVGKQPYRNQTVTFDPKVGFILDPVTTLDAGTFRCKGIVGGFYNSSYYFYDGLRLLPEDIMIFTLDVNTGHLLVTPTNHTIIVKEGSEAVLPCKAIDPSITVKLYQESLFGFELMKLGRIADPVESLFDHDDDDDDNDHGDINSDDDDEDEHSVLKDDKKGFIFSAVQHSDENTYKCEAKKQNEREVMYFYMHVDETQLLRGTMEHYITVYKGENLVVPCKPYNINTTLKLYYTSPREIFVESGSYSNRTVMYDPRVGFTLTGVNTSDAGSYRCDAVLKRNTESAYFYVYVSDDHLLEPVNDSNIYPSGSGSRIVVPCMAKDPAVKVHLLRVITPTEFILIPPRRILFGPTAVYDQKKGFTVFYSSHRDSEHLMCLAQLGQKHESLFFYWHGEDLLLHPSSFHILADAGDKAVLPCRPTDADINVKLFVGASSYKQREIKIGQQPHRNQTVTFDPAVGFTLYPVSHLDSSRYMCLAESDTHYHSKNFHLDVREPARIVKTNLSVNKSLEQIAGQDMIVFCKSEGMPFPVILWFKDNKPLVIDTSYELSDANQSLTIKMVKPEHVGTYSCLVRNELGEDTAKGPVTITGMEPVSEPLSITDTNLNVAVNLEAKLGESLVIFCKSEGKPEPTTKWFKDGKPVFPDNGTMKLGHRNQELYIIPVKFEHAGIYRCVSTNGHREVHMEGKVTVTDDSANSISVITASVVCVFLLLAAVAALIFYVRRRRLIYTLRNYMRVKKPREETEEHGDFSDTLQEEYFRSPRVHGRDNDIGNLIVSECLPETSRQGLRYSDDYSNINSVSKSSEIGNFPSHASGVRSVEMKSV